MARGGHGARAQGIADRRGAPRSAAGIRLSRQLADHASAPRDLLPRAWGTRLPSSTGTDRLGMWRRGVRRRARARARRMQVRAHVPRPVGRRLFDDPLDDGTTGAAAGRHLGPAGRRWPRRLGWGSGGWPGARVVVLAVAGASGTEVACLASIVAGGSFAVDPRV